MNFHRFCLASDQGHFPCEVNGLTHSYNYHSRNCFFTFIFPFILNRYFKIDFYLIFRQLFAGDFLYDCRTLPLSHKTTFKYNMAYLPHSNLATE